MASYFFVGLVVLALDVTAFMAMTILGAGYLAANFAAKTLGMVFGFFLHGRYVFRWHKKRSPAARWILYIINFLVGLVLSSLALIVFVEGFCLPAQLGKICAEAIAVTSTYLINRFIVFRD